MGRKYFGTDGIRDVAGRGLLAPAMVRALGEAAGRVLQRERPGVRARVLAGRDTRRSGAGILGGLAAGLLEAGHELVDGGVLTTPAVQALCREEGFDLAVVISASHNPAADNGIKIFGADGRKLSEAAEEELEGLMDQALAGELTPGGGGGRRVGDTGAGERYLRFLCGVCFPALDLAGMGLVLDCANGAATELAPRALELLGASPLLRGASPDGDNINAGVGVFHVEELGPLVLHERAALGMALDGDGDRVLMVDERGRLVDGDHMLGLLAAHMKAAGRLTGDLLVTTVMANLGLQRHLESLGIRVETVPVGDRFVAEAMAAGDGVLGGEQSGHVIFREGGRWFGDGLYTALRILQVMQETGRPLSELAGGVRKFPQRLVNVRVTAKPPVEDVEELAARRDAVQQRMGRDGRVLLRYSGTEPLLRVMVEGRHPAEVEAAAEELAEAARRALGG